MWVIRFRTKSREFRSMSSAMAAIVSSSSLFAAALVWSMSVVTTLSSAERSEIAADYGVHPNHVTDWKKQLLENGSDVFARGRDDEAQRVAAERDESYRKVGDRQVQLDFLKKIGCRRPSELRSLIDSEEEQLSIREQCMLPGLARSSYYRSPRTHERAPHGDRR